MLHHDRIDICKRTDPIKSNRSKKYMIYYCWFFNHGFKFQGSVCNGCANIGVIAIITMKNVHKISKSEAINLLEGFVLEDREICIKYCLNF